jgi:hypothetical protein
MLVHIGESFERDVVYEPARVQSSLIGLDSKCVGRNGHYIKAFKKPAIKPLVVHIGAQLELNKLLE